MQIPIRLSFFRHKFLAAGLLLAVCSFVLAGHVYASSSDTAPSGRLVTFHDRGGQRVILTHARTVRDALKDAGLSVASADNVEPRLDTELVATDYAVNIYRARPVIVVDGLFRQKIMAAAQTPRGIVAAAGIKLQAEDKTVMTTSASIATDGASVVLTIDRATAFTLRLYGTATTAYSRATTVGEMLAQKQIKLAPSDTLSVAAETPLTTGMTVEIWRNGTQTTTIEEEVAFPIKRIQDVDREVSYRNIQTPGVKGKKSVTYEIEMRNGKEVARKEIQSVVIEQPKEQVEVVGAKPSFSGDFASALAKLRQCEAGGNYANKRNPLYRGAYQFGYGTWANYGGYYDPADAPPAVQDQAARALYERRGWQPWPHCGASLPDTYR